MDICYHRFSLSLLFMYFGTIFQSFGEDKNMSLWISSFQDQSYYEQMAEMYAEKSGSKINLQVEAYGFREMPDKLGAVMRTGEGAPDLVQLDETFFGVFLNGPPPFVDLTKKIRKAQLNKTLHKQRLEVFTYEGKTYGVPQSLSALVLYYRKDMFEDFNIQPEDITTWEDFAKVGERLMSENGQRFLALDGTLFDSLLRQKGSDLFDAKGILYLMKILPYLSYLNLPRWQKNRSQCFQTVDPFLTPFFLAEIWKWERYCV